jgi:hypothetical protein
MMHPSPPVGLQGVDADKTGSVISPPLTHKHHAAPAHSLAHMHARVRACVHARTHTHAHTYNHNQPHTSTHTHSRPQWHRRAAQCGVGARDAGNGFLRGEAALHWRARCRQGAPGAYVQQRGLLGSADAKGLSGLPGVLCGASWRCSGGDGASGRASCCRRTFGVHREATGAAQPP